LILLRKKTTPEFTGVAKVQGGDAQTGIVRTESREGDNSVLNLNMDTPTFKIKAHVIKLRFTAENRVRFALDLPYRSGISKPLERIAADFTR
jgi:hypothetical protein